MGNILTDQEPETHSDLWSPGFKVRDQLKTNRCAGFTLARILRVGYAQLGNDPGDFSPNDAYFKSRVEHGGEDEDSGTYLRTSFKGLQRYGCCLESARPSRVEEINKPTTWPQQRKAHKYRGLRRYNQIFAEEEERVRQVRIALSSGIAVAGGWSIPKSFRDYKNGVYDPTDAPQAGIGHAMAIVGHDPWWFKLEVHYGESFGVSGFMYVSEAFLASAHTLWIGDVRK